MSGTLFAAAFIWLAIYFFDVETEVLKVFAIMSGLLVVLLMGVAFVFSFIVKYLRRSSGGMLENIDLLESEVESEPGGEMPDKQASENIHQKTGRQL